MTKEDIQKMNLKKKTRKRTRKFEIDGVTVTTTTSKIIYRSVLTSQTYKQVFRSASSVGSATCADPRVKIQNTNQNLIKMYFFLRKHNSQLFINERLFKRHNLLMVHKVSAQKLAKKKERKKITWTRIRIRIKMKSLIIRV